MEKTISYPLPRLGTKDTTVTVPLFIMILNIDDGKEPIIKAMDTLMFLTNANTSAENLTVKVTFRRADGSVVPAPANPGDGDDGARPDRRGVSGDDAQPVIATGAYSKGHPRARNDLHPGRFRPGRWG